MGVPDAAPIFQGRSDKDIKVSFFKTFCTAVEVALQERQGDWLFTHRAALCIPA